MLPPSHLSKVADDIGWDGKSTALTYPSALIPD
jgi:hypothetical protein